MNKKQVEKLPKWRTKPFKRVVIHALHIRTDEDGNEYLNTDKEYRWQIDWRTQLANGEKNRKALPPIGSIVEVRTWLGIKPVVVVSTKIAQNETPEEREKLKEYSSLSRVLRYSDEPLNPELLEQFESYMKTRKAQDADD